MNLRNQMMPWTQLGQWESMWNQLKLSELPWDHAGGKSCEWSLHGAWSAPFAACMASLGCANLPIFTEPSRLLTWAGAFQRAAPISPLPASLPGPARLWYPLRDHQSLFSVVQRRHSGCTGRDTNLWLGARPPEMTVFAFFSEHVLQAVLC